MNIYPLKKQPITYQSRDNCILILENNKYILFVKYSKQPVGQ